LLRTDHTNSRNRVKCLDSYILCIVEQLFNHSVLRAYVF
jgi:hypothetical protein